jgi:hypothetical protein
MATEDPLGPLALDEEHASTCSGRWLQRRNNLRVDEDFENLPDDWYAEQCGECRYYAPLLGVAVFASDWGICTHPNSPFDGRVMFEHDGCRHYEGASCWISSHPGFADQAEKRRKSLE